MKRVRIFVVISLVAIFASVADSGAVIWPIDPMDPGYSDFQGNPPAADGSKVIIAHTDHLWGVGGPNRNFRPRLHQTVTVNLSAASGAFLVEWFNPSTGETRKAAQVEGGGGYSLQRHLAAMRCCISEKERMTRLNEWNLRKFDSATRLLQPKDAAAAEQGTGRTAKNTVKT
jgi:hypothetical protein